MRTFTLCLLTILALTPPARAQSHERMDYGPYLANSTVLSRKAPATVDKAILIKLADGQAGVSFDTETLRLDRVWTPPPTPFYRRPPTGWPALLELGGVSFLARLHPEGPVVRGDTRLMTPVGPGWSTTDAFEDPRPNHKGPLPTDRAKYSGLYLHGDQVILSYRVADTSVLETHGFVRQGANFAFTRTLELAATTKPLSLLICDTRDGKVSITPPDKPTTQPFAGAPPARNATLLLTSHDQQTALTVLNAPDQSSWHLDRNTLALRLPPSNATRTFRLVFSNAPTIDAATFKTLTAAPAVADIMPLKPLCAGGPPRWPIELTTAGRRGDDRTAYTVDTLTPPENNPYNALLRFSALDFFPDGRLALATLSGDVWIVSNIDQKLDALKWRRFATGLYQPTGLKIIKDQVYVVGRDQITRLHDLNNDGEADFYENFNNDALATERQDEINLDLQTDQDGNFYYAKAGAGVTPDRLHDHTGCLIRTTADGKKIDVFATGLRSPNGLCIDPKGHIFCTDNEGTWSPASRMNLITRGGFYGQMETHHRPTPPTAFDQPLVWLPRAFDPSPGSPVWIDNPKWGPLGNHLLGTSYGVSTLYAVLTQDTDTGCQGAVYKLPLSFQSGIMRGRVNPMDGQLYLCGLRGWITNAAREGALHRVRYTGKPITLPIDFRATTAGLVIRFNQPLDRATATDPGNWAAEHWQYKWTNQYGSPEYSVRDPQKVGHDELPIESVALSDDGATVRLKPTGLQPVMQMRVQFHVKDRAGQDVSMQLYNTIHALTHDAD